MTWKDWIAFIVAIFSAGLQSALSANTHFAPMMNFPIVAVGLLTSYLGTHVMALTAAIVLTRIAIGTEGVPITVFRSFLCTYLSVKMMHSLFNHGWLLASATVATGIIVDFLAAVIAYPKYVSSITMTDIVVSVLFNVVITLLCAIPIEIFYRRKHIHGF